MPSSILKTLQPPNLGEGFPPLTPPNAPAQPFGAQLGKSHGLLLLLHFPSNIPWLFYENHWFHYVGRAKWTLEIIDFHTFSQSLKPLENIENQNCLFRIRISNLFSSLDSPLTSFLVATFQRKHLKNKHLRKHMHFRKHHYYHWNITTSENHN